MISIATPPVPLWSVEFYFLTEYQMPRGRPKLSEEEKAFSRQSRSYDFTDYSFSESDPKHPRTLDELVEWWKRLEVSWSLGSLEICPETKRPHVQGRAVFRRKYSIKQLKKIHPTCAWFPTLATADFNYGRKLESVALWEVDNRKKTTNIAFARCKAMAAAGTTLRDIFDAEGCTYQVVRSCQMLLNYVEPARSVGGVDVILAVGDDAVSKVYVDAAGAPVYEPTSPDSWDGYDAHDVVHIRVSKGITREYLWKLVGQQPFRVNCKWGSRQARYTKIYLSCMCESELALICQRYQGDRLVYSWNLEPCITRRL